MSLLHPRISVVPAFVALALTAGCGETFTPVSPVLPLVEGQKNPPAGEFYPLSVGNVWSYHRAYTLVIEVIIGPPYKKVETYEGVVERRIVGTEDIDGVEYVVERMTLTPNDEPKSSIRWTRYRQDHAGLYVADVPGSDPPTPPPDALAASGRHATTAFHDALIAAADRTDRPFIGRALRDHARRVEAAHKSLAPIAGPAPNGAGRPGDINPGELLYLSYPLHPGVAWFNRVEPFFVRSEVEAHEVLDCPAGRFPVYRVRVDNEFLDPADRVVVWYGRRGRLALSIHTETMALDVETGETARITTDDIETLTGLSLVRPPLHVD